MVLARNLNDFALVFGAPPPKRKNLIKSSVSYVISHISKCNFSIKCINFKGRRLAQQVEQRHMYRGFVLTAADPTFPHEEAHADTGGRPSASTGLVGLKILKV